MSPSFTFAKGTQAQRLDIVYLINGIVKNDYRPEVGVLAPWLQLPLLTLRGRKGHNSCLANYRHGTCHSRALRHIPR